MKTRLLPLFLGILSSTGAAAQSSFNASADMDINNIRARSLVHGDLWHTADSAAARVCEFPAGSGKHIAGAGGFWLGGYDATGNLRLSAPTYRSAGLEFWPGPIGSGDSATRFAQAARWNKIWVITAAEVTQHRQNAVHNPLNTPQAVLRWPGAGNPDARDASGQPLTVTGTGAPFVDLNSNGIYEPLLGDYPRMRGDKMHWWLFNDDTYFKWASQTAPMGVEVGASAWAYHRSNDIDNVIYYSYEVVNRSAITLNGLRAGFWADPEIGYAFDDDAWYDSTRRLGMAYNGTGTDQQYGATPPSMGILLLEQPGESASMQLASGNMVAYRNDASVNGNPRNGDEYYNYLNRRTKAGAAVTFSWDAEPPCVMNNKPDDVKMLVNSAYYTLAAGSSLRFSMALVACQDAGGCPNVHLTCLNRVADNARTVYWTGLPALGTGAAAQQQALRIYPNPAGDVLYVSGLKAEKPNLVQVFDASGRQVTVSYEQKGTSMEMSVASLAPGVYHLRIGNGAQVQQCSFVRN